MPGAVAQRVLDQVRKCPLELNRVGVERGQVAVEVQPNARGIGLVGYGRSQDLIQRARREVRLRGARLQLGEMQELVDQAREAGGLGEGE